MSRRVLKFAMYLGISTRVPVGASAKVVLAAIQRGTVTLWFEVRDDDPVSEPRIFQVFGTGEDLPPNVEHVGSVITENGDYVWHFYEVLR